MKKKSRYEILPIDTSKKYLIGMIPKGQRRYTLKDTCDIVPCAITYEYNNIHAVHEGYEDFWIADKLFDWLLYTKEITLYEET